MQDSYRVGAPDELEITVLPEPAIVQAVKVRPDGMISVPLVGDVPAGGRTIAEIAADIEQRISRFKRGAVVNVTLVAAASTSITVLGEVAGPSAFPLVKATRVAEAIGSVGGTRRPFASDSGIRVIRAGGGEVVVYTVDLTAIRRGDLSTNILLAPGDIIYVPPSILARIGYAFQAVLFPLQPLMGIGSSAGGNIVTGGF